MGTLTLSRRWGRRRPDDSARARGPGGRRGPDHRSGSPAGSGRDALTQGVPILTPASTPGDSTRELAWWQAYTPRGPGWEGLAGRRFDTHGNVWDMGADYYDANYYRVSPPRGPTGPPTGSTRVARGGSWSNSPNECRSAFRARVSCGQRDHIVAFRVACDIGRPR